MDLTTSIASMATSMSNMSLQNNISNAMMKKTMDTQENMAAGILRMMDAAPARAFAGDVGAIFDARA